MSVEHNIPTTVREDFVAALIKAINEVKYDSKVYAQIGGSKDKFLVFKHALGQQIYSLDLDKTLYHALKGLNYYISLLDDNHIIVRYVLLTDVDALIPTKETEK